MRRAFLLWLSFLFFAAFAVAGALSYHQCMKHAEARALQLMNTRLSDLMQLINHSSAVVKQVVELNTASTLERTRALAEIIRLEPAVLQNQEGLQGLCNDLGAARLRVTDGEGLTIAAVPQEDLGYDFSANEQSRIFLPCIGQPGVEVCERELTADADRVPMQLAAVNREDAPGLVQMGFRARYEYAMRQENSIGKLAPEHKLGKGGHILGFRGGELLNKNELSGSPAELLALPVEEACSVTLSDVDYLAYAVASNEYRLVGLLDYREIRQQALQSLRGIILNNLALFIVMFFAVDYLLQRIVVWGIHRVNRSLSNITTGRLEGRVEEKSYPEFITLSNGINRMVDALRDQGEEKRQSMRRELEYARSIQSTVLPNKFPAFPNHPEFDLYATCAQAKVVGGDFYDFFMQGEEHICFLVADIAATGIPAALFMMRCMSTIRSLARNGGTMAELVGEVNRALCEGNTSGMRVCLFLANLCIKTGQMRYVNAGRPHALLQHARGRYEMMPAKSGVELGYLPDATYTECCTTLCEGDRIFLFSEGAINAMDASNTPFGTARLQEALSVEAATPTDVIMAVRTALRRFIDKRELNTDITMLSFEYKGPLHARTQFATAAGKADGVAEAIAAPLESILASPLGISDIQASVHSILNALPEECEVDISLKCNEKQAEIVLRYAAQHFNPLLGLPHLPVDRTEYRSGEDGSTLTLWKNLE